MAATSVTIELSTFVARQHVSSVNLGTYELLPLGPRQIRLLDIPAPERQQTDSLQASLRVVSLDEHPYYVALSYVWGAPAVPLPGADNTGEQNESVAIAVTPNCLLAMRTLSQALGGMAGVWVDSICINQSDEVEKFSQIALMGEIYSMADTVHIWLGDSGPGTDQAVDTFFRIAGSQQALRPDPESVLGVTCKSLGALALSRAVVRHFYDDYYQPWRVFLREEGLKTTLVSLIIRQHPHLPPETCRGVIDIISREWLFRIWTLQELVLSQNPILWCGKKSLPFRSLVISIISIEVSYRWCQMLGSRRAYHLVRRWTVLTCIWMERQAAIRGREPGDQLKYLGDYNRFLRRLELVDAVIMTAVGASVVGALITYSEPLGGPILLVFVPILWGLAVLVPGRFMKLYHRIKVSSSVGRNISTFQDFKYSITNEMVSRMATDARDRVHGIRGLLDPEAQAVLNHTSATSAPQLFQDYFETVATTDTLACRLIFCASGPLCEGGPSWVPDLERAHKAWTQPQSVFWNAQYQFQEDFIPADGPQEKFVPVLSISDDHRRLTVDRIDVGKVLWVGEAFRAPPAAVEMLLSEDGGFSAAHLHNLRQLCEPLLRRRSDSDNNTKLSTSEWPQLAYVLLKRHEMTDLSLIEAKLTKWIKVVRKWRTEEDSAAVLAGLRDGQLLKFHDAICNNLEASKRRLFVCQARDKLRLGNGPEGLQPDDDVVGITHYGADSLLAVRHGPQDACSRLVGSLELEGDWWRRADLERETFTPLVLE